MDVPIPIQPLEFIQLAAMTRLHVAIGDPEAGSGHEGGMYWGRDILIIYGYKKSSLHHLSLDFTVVFMPF